MFAADKVKSTLGKNGHSHERVGVASLSFTERNDADVAASTDSFRDATVASSHGFAFH